jgi:hypothetical protein
MTGDQFCCSVSPAHLRCCFGSEIRHWIVPSGVIIACYGLRIIQEKTGHSFYFKLDISTANPDSARSYYRNKILLDPDVPMRYHPSRPRNNAHHCYPVAGKVPHLINPA